MSILRKMLDAFGKNFQKGRKLHRLHPLYDALDSFLYSTNEQTSERVHVRDAVDLKRVMITVVLALLPATLFGIYNTGYQSLQANLGNLDPNSISTWQNALYASLGLEPTPTLSHSFLLGLFYYIPLWFVTFLFGGFWEVLFACTRKHPISEGFLVTGMIFPLILPPTTPLWMVALAISFGVVIGKEIFGGVGKNIFNPALIGRIFLFFAYPSAISGSSVWIAGTSSIDAVSGATALAHAQNAGLTALEQQLTWLDAFWGFMPGSLGETSTFCCLIGALVLLITGVASWKTMVGIAAGTLAASLLFNTLGSPTNPMFDIPFHWHIVLGGWAFGTVFMATDPVSSAFPGRTQFLYGAMIGILAISIRTLNPAYPEGMMMAILFMNMFAPLMDHCVISLNIRRRKKRMTELN